MSPAATLESGVPLHNTMGAMLIGVIISGVLHGICWCQAFRYFISGAQDPQVIRALVVTTCTLDAVHLSFVSHTIYHYFISSFTQEEMLQKLVWSVIMEALLTGINAASVQTFYAYRVWKLSKRNYFLTVPILTLIMATGASGTAWVIIAIRMTTYKELLTINPLTITINALSTAVDVLIVASLCFLLQRSRTGFKRSDTIITRLMVFVVNTGMLTTICAVSSLVSLVTSPNTLIYASFYFCIGRFYTNSFLATLNARKSLSGSTKHSERDTSNIAMSIPASVLENMRKSPQDIAIRIETTQEAISDRDRSKLAPEHYPLKNMSRKNGSDGDTLSTVEELGKPVRL